MIIFTKILSIGLFCLIIFHLCLGYFANLQCGDMDAVDCKIQFRLHFERSLRQQILLLIQNLTEQSEKFIQKILTGIPPSDVERHSKLNQLVNLYTQSMQEAMAHQNDTKQLFLTIAGGNKYQNFNLPELLGERNAAYLDNKNIQTVEEFTNVIGNVWIELFEALRENDKRQFPNYQQINEVIDMMMHKEGLVKLEMFKSVLRNIFEFLNVGEPI